MAVLEDIQQLGIDEIYCLGDVVGYGPNPRDLCRNLSVSILGNHDQAAIFDPDGFNPVALRAIYWTREELEARRGNPAENSQRWDYLGEMPRSRSEGSFLFVHGSPRDPTNEYVFPEDVYYVVLTDDQLTFRRVDYGVDTTAAKIYENPELDNMLGDRIREGR